MELNCKICFESFSTNELRRPRSLSCGHTLCGVCSTRMIVDGVLICPLCQRSLNYHGVEDISINHELEDIIDKLASILTSPLSAAANSNPETIYEAAYIPKGPKLHNGICEDHGAYKVHHCNTHDISICGDCAVAYHMEADCHRVPIEKVLKDKKAGNCKKIESCLSYLQGTGKYIKDTELQIKTKIEKLQSEQNALQQQLIFCENSAPKCTDLINECEKHQKQAQAITSFLELDKEIKLTESTLHKTNQFKDTLKQGANGFGGMLALGPLIGLVSFDKAMYVTHTHYSQQRWGHIIYEDGHTLMQDFRNIMPPTDSVVVNLKELADHLTSQRHVYMKFNTKGGIQLGMVIIKVNEQAPRRAQQFVDLILGKTGARYSGSTWIAVSDKGMPQERLYCIDYLTRNNERCRDPLFSDFETTEKISHKHGLVTCDLWSSIGYNHGCFSILTKNGYTGTWTGPAIGEVISGLQVVEKIIEDNLVIKSLSDSSQVIIAESGLVVI